MDFINPGRAAATQVAYVLIANPGDKAQKPIIYAARFQLLTLPEGQSALVSHQSDYAQLGAEPPAGLGQPDHPGEGATGGGAGQVIREPHRDLRQ